MASFSADMTLKGQKQGDIGDFDLLSFTYSVSSPTDKATGVPTGRIEISVIDVDIDIKPDTVMLLNAIYENEGITGLITFYYYGGTAGGKQKYMTVEIKAGRCALVKQMFNSTDHNAFFVKLQIIGTTVVTTAIEGGKTASVDWYQTH